MKLTKAQLEKRKKRRHRNRPERMYVRQLLKEVCRDYPATITTTTHTPRTTATA